MSEEKLNDYRSYFKRFLEGKVLSEEFVEEASKFLGWARVVFRHYINWLMLERKVDGEFAEWALKKVKIEERCKLLETYWRCLQEIKRGEKSTLWAFMSKEAFEALNELAPAKRSIGIVRPRRRKSLAIILR